MLLISLLISVLFAQEKTFENSDLCGLNTMISEESTYINKVCFIKIENLKDSWQARFHFHDGSSRNYFMKSPSFDQSLSVGQKRTVFKAQLYSEDGTGILVGEIAFYYPYDKSQPEFIIGSIPPGFQFHVPNMGVPGLKTP